MRLYFPAISADGLAFYFRIFGNQGDTTNGIYETVRTSTTVPFPPAIQMPKELQIYESVNAVSSDHMTLFVEDINFQMTALTRKSLKDPFINPEFATPATKLPGFRTRPLGDCQSLVGNDTMMGCPGEDIELFTK